MRRAFTFLLAGCLGCSTGEPPSADPNPGAGGSTAASGGTGPTSGGAGGNATGGTGGTGMASGGTGNGGSGGGGDGGTGMMPPPPPSGVGIGVFSQCSDPANVGPTPVRRLSRLEYANSVRDLFGVEVNLGDLPSDELLGGIFTANVRTRMTTDNFTRYDTMAKLVADQVAADLAARSSCSIAEAACTQTFLAGKARQAFHGVLEAADQQALVELHNAVLADDPTLAAATAVRFILLSPRFLFQVEFGTPEAKASRLSPGEVAGRLASFLWRSVPDETLLAAADSGGLANADGLRQQAMRMLGDPKAEPMLRAFANEWLGLEAPMPGAPALDAAIDAEAGNFFVAAAQGAGTYPELLTSTQGPGTAELAQFYGGSLSGGTMTVPPERQGLLLRAAFMRSHVRGERSSPTQRGLQIRQALLCDPVEFPKDNVNMNIPPLMPGQTENDVFALHGSEPACVGCHSVMDPIGFAFGQYGPDGVYDTSLATSTAGEIVPGNLNPLEASFETATELANILATNQSPQQCFVIQMNRFALGRSETQADACGLSGVWDAVKETQSLKTLIVEIAASHLMQVRNIVRPGEACQ